MSTVTRRTLVALTILLLLSFVLAYRTFFMARQDTELTGRAYFFRWKCTPIGCIQEQRHLEQGDCNADEGCFPNDTLCRLSCGTTYSSSAPGPQQQPCYGCPTCQVVSYVNPGQRCEDFGLHTFFLQCSQSCPVQAGRCGDGVLQNTGIDAAYATADDEICDQGEGTGGNSNLANAFCRPNCKPAACGDGIVDDTQGEVCDEGPAMDSCADGTACDCNIASWSHPETGRTYADSCCADGSQCRARGTLTCPEGCGQALLSSSSVSSSPALCGDGFRTGVEECDDGNRFNNDGCSAWCIVERASSSAAAFQSAARASQQQASALSSDASRPASSAPNSSRSSSIPPNCGDSILNAGEQCDDGPAGSARCSAFCSLIVDIDPFIRRSCGDSVLNSDEYCDKGPENSRKPNATCRPDCTHGRCGDGITDTYFELCDDGNTQDGDTCSADCLEGLPDSPVGDPLRTIEFSFVPLTAAIRPAAPISVGTLGQTGPATILLIAMGGGIGYAIMRRRR